MSQLRAESIELLRSKHRRLRREIDSDTLIDHADALAEHVTALPEYQNAEHIAAYIAILGEINLEPVMISGADDGKQFYLPILRGESMVFAPWSADEPLVKRSFGLLEPDCDESLWIRAEQIDLVLAPLVVFDAQCNRIGQGGGFYDRTFAFTRSTSKPVLVGVAHESQRESALDPQPWDIPLDKIVTEVSVYCNPEQ